MSDSPLSSPAKERGKQKVELVLYFVRIGLHL